MFPKNGACAPSISWIHWPPRHAVSVGLGMWRSASSGCSVEGGGVRLAGRLVGTLDQASEARLEHIYQRSGRMHLATDTLYSSSATSSPKNRVARRRQRRDRAGQVKPSSASLPFACSSATAQGEARCWVAPHTSRSCSRPDRRHLRNDYKRCRRRRPEQKALPILPHRIL
jgi:hypothetical protein